MSPLLGSNCFSQKENIGQVIITVLQLEYALK